MVSNKQKREEMIILYPGKFKPVHPGHIKKILMYANDPEKRVYVIIAPAPRDGIKAETVSTFMNNVFKNYPNVNIVISQVPSPVAYAYTLTRELSRNGRKEFKLISSGKDNDMKRSIDYYSKFAVNGPYNTYNVIPVMPDENDNVINNFNEAPYSATDIREVVRLADINAFREVYGILVDMKLASCADIDNFYEALRNDMRDASAVMESTAINHIPHPYEFSDFTFGDIKNLVSDLSKGNVTDSTEKIDGIALYASIDENGRPIFARNMTQLTKTPLTADDILTSRRYGAMGIAGVFERAIRTINTLFADISNEYFNFPYRDMLERKWVCMEIVDTNNRNIVKYDHDFITIHGCKTVQYSRNGAVIATMDGRNETVYDELVKEIQDAYQRHDDLDMIVRMTPKVMFAIINPQRMFDDIDSILDKYGLDDMCTIGDYKRSFFKEKIRGLRAFAAVTGDILNALLYRWSFGKAGKTLAQTFSGLTNLEGHSLEGKTMKMISDFEKTDLKKLEEECMRPIKEWFMIFGNELLKSASGTIAVNTRNDKMRIREAIARAKEKYDHGYSLADKDLSDYCDKVLRNVDEISSIEGIVFTWKGRKMKITGYYPLINKMIGFENE